MLWSERPADSKFTAYNLFSIIAATQQRLAEIEAIEHTVELCDRQFSKVQVFRETDTDPRAILCSGGGTTIVGISGAQNVNQFSGLLNGYFQRPDEVFGDGANPFASAAAATMLARVQAFQESGGPLLIGGYSYGAAVAWPLYAHLKRFNPSRQIHLVTFGAPKAGSHRLQTRWAQPSTPTVSYINNTDPVPLVLPNRLQAPALHASLTRTASTNAEEYIQPRTHEELDPYGNVTNNVANPTGVTGDQTQAILGWIAGRQGWNTSGHHWTTYKQTLFLARCRYLDRPSEARPQELAVANAIEESGVAEMLPITPAQPTTTVPSGQPITVHPVPLQQTGPRRALATKTVYWNGVAVCTMPSRRLARNLRATLKRLVTATRRATDFDHEMLGYAAELQAIFNLAGKSGTIT